MPHAPQCLLSSIGSTQVAFAPLPVPHSGSGHLLTQLFDTQKGARKGMWADLMKPVVANLTNEDMLAIAAYTASREP